VIGADGWTQLVEDIERLDPVNGQLALVHALVQRYRGAGMTTVSLTIYPQARHEVLNETNLDEVIHDVITWIGTVVPS
jgi:alpha-beta hydrolase superfamily lysophospholipase